SLVPSRESVGMATTSGRRTVRTSRPSVATVVGRWHAGTSELEPGARRPELLVLPPVLSPVLSPSPVLEKALVMASPKALVVPLAESSRKDLVIALVDVSPVPPPKQPPRLHP